MMYDLEHAKARQAVRLAKENLRRCERQFGGAQVVEIEEAERRLAEANAKLRELGE
jgi:hypothetical protein